MHSSSILVVSAKFPNEVLVSLESTSNPLLLYLTFLLMSFHPDMEVLCINQFHSTDPHSLSKKLHDGSIQKGQYDIIWLQ
jgi:hypothetical protein